MIFKYGLETVLTQRILIDFEAILENEYFAIKKKAFGLNGACYAGHFGNYILRIAPNR